MQLTKKVFLILWHFCLFYVLLKEILLNSRYIIYSNTNITKLYTMKCSILFIHHIMCDIVGVNRWPNDLLKHSRHGLYDWFKWVIWPQPWQRLRGKHIYYTLLLFTSGFGNTKYSSYDRSNNFGFRKVEKHNKHSSYVEKAMSSTNNALIRFHTHNIFRSWWHH